MAIRLTVSPLRKRRNPSTANRSGAMYRIFTSPRRTSACTRSTSRTGSVLLMNRAATPFAFSPSTWSFISAISGEITSVTPSIASAGSW